MHPGASGIPSSQPQVTMHCLHLYQEAWTPCLFQGLFAGRHEQGLEILKNRGNSSACTHGVDPGIPET